MYVGPQGAGEIGRIGMKTKKNTVSAFGSPSVGHGVSGDTANKPGLVFESLLARPLDGVGVFPANPTTPARLAKVHDPDYVEALATGDPIDLAASNGIGWDEEYFDFVLTTIGGIEDAVRSALGGTVSGACASGLHHARYEGGAGFCTVNGLVVGANAALEAGAGRVLIVDFDAHCGGGTASLIAGRRGIEQVDVSVSRYDWYADDANSRLLMSSADNYLYDCAAMLDSVIDPATVDLVIYNAGMDPHEKAGGISGITTDMIREREGLLFSWARAMGIPVAFVLAGGYTGASTMNQVVDLHRITFEEAVKWS